MSPEVKQRMLHIRIDRAIHKVLRKAAAEYDISIQEIVADAVEKKLEGLDTEIEMEAKLEELEKKAQEYEVKCEELEKKAREYELKISEEIETELDSSARDGREEEIVLEYTVSVNDRLGDIENSIAKISDAVEEIKNMLSENE